VESARREANSELLEQLVERAAGVVGIAGRWRSGVDGRRDRRLAAAVPSRATVTRGMKSAQAFVLSFTAIRAGIGFRH
jgi:hypothetical protein